MTAAPDSGGAGTAQKAIRLLLVESDPADAATFERALQAGGRHAFAVSRAASLDAAQRAVAASPFDVVVLDLDLPDSHGLDTLAQFRVDVTDTVPIFVLVGLDDDTDVDEIVFRSGNEYLIKGRLDHSLLPRLLNHAIERQRTQISMRRLITTNPDGIIVVDFDGVVLFANAMAAEMFDRSPRELVGHSFGFPVVAGEAADINTLTNRFAEMRSVEIDWNGLAAFLVSLRDVTERLSMMQALQIAKDQAELANRVRDEILANMNHEVRTPLNAIIGFSDLLLADSKEDGGSPTAQSYLSCINQSGWQLLELLNDVLDMANIRTNNFELEEATFDVVKAVEAVATLAAGQLGRIAVCQPVQLHQMQQTMNTIGNFRLSRALGARPHAWSKGDIVEHRHVSKQGVMLKNKAHPTIPRRLARRVAAIEQHAAGIGEVQPGDDPEQGGLARSRRAEKSHQFALVNCQIDPAQGGKTAEGFCDAMDFDHR